MKRDVLLLVKTRLPQRLLRQATEAGIVLSEARTCEGGLQVCLSPSNARLLQALCTRYQLPVETLSIRGGGALLAFMKRRCTLLAAIAAFVLVTALLTSRIWRVDIAFTGSAASRGDAAGIRAALAGLGVRPGCSANINAKRLAGELAARLSGYSFIGIQRQGMRLLVSAAPEAPAPEVYALDAARDLYARDDGIVVSVNVRAGVGCVEPGETVRRGQLLIRGEERDRGDVSRPIAALGEVVIRTWFTGTASLPTTRAMVRYTGNESRECHLSILDMAFPMVQGKQFDRQMVEVEVLPIGGLFLPVEIHRQLRREIRETAVPEDEAALKSRLATLALADAVANLSRSGIGEYAIARQWLDYENTDGGTTMNARAVIEITTDTAATREALYLGG